MGFALASALAGLSRSGGAISPPQAKFLAIRSRTFQPAHRACGHRAALLRASGRAIDCAGSLAGHAFFLGGSKW